MSEAPMPREGRSSQAPAGSPRKVIVNASLFFATLLTTFWAGAGVEAPIALAFSVFGLASPPPAEVWHDGLWYMGALMGILLAHELGHYVMARRHRVDTSLPYFVPIPPFIMLFGTLGAVILMRGRIRSRDALMDVGAAGPLAGLCVALPLIYFGLKLSPIQPMPTDGFAIIEGNSLLYMGLKWLALGPIPKGYDVFLHPMAWAGWIGLLVTAINLVPIGQLDGGHVFYALFGKLHTQASRAFHVGLFCLGAGLMIQGARTASQLGLEGDAYMFRVMTGAQWLFFGGVLLIMGKLTRKGLSHPPTDDARLTPFRRAIGILCLILFVASFPPVPIRIAV